MDTTHDILNHTVIYLFSNSQPNAEGVCEKLSAPNVSIRSLRVKYTNIIHLFFLG